MIYAPRTSLVPSQISRDTQTAFYWLRGLVASIAVHRKCETKNVIVAPRPPAFVPPHKRARVGNSPFAVSTHTETQTDSHCAHGEFGKVEYSLGAVYRPPGMGFEFVNKLNDFLDELRAPSRRVITAGDFDLGDIDMDGLHPTSRETLVSSTLVDMIFSHDLTQVLKYALRI